MGGGPIVIIVSVQVLLHRFTQVYTAIGRYTQVYSDIHRTGHFGFLLPVKSFLVGGGPKVIIVSVCNLYVRFTQVYTWFMQVYATQGLHRYRQMGRDGTRSLTIVDQQMVFREAFKEKK